MYDVTERIISWMNMAHPRYFRATLLCFLLVLAGCNAGGPDGSTLFVRLDPDDTGVTFANELPEDPAFNILNYLNYYNGGGVAVGDVNSDGLQDLYFTANAGSNKLYLNKGDFTFEDVTERAGVAGQGDWKTGVTMADVNADGHVDIYVCVVSGWLGRTGKNQLFVNDGDGTFSERAAEFGLDFQSLSTHASFFDYDGDGDLDLYLVNHSVHQLNTYGPAAPLRNRPSPLATDRLLRNDEGRFVDVSQEAGLYNEIVGYGLSVMVSDLNVDGCPDVYVGNDFHENDYLYYNNCDGTFREAIQEATAHNSQASMGADAADFNNDGLPDLAVLDMLPEREDILKTSDNAELPEVYDLKLKFGYHHQLSRNVLQLNRGDGRFSDVALLAGLEATDWSWAPLFADFDNDGLMDLFVSNGIYRRPNDLDFVHLMSTEDVQTSLAHGIDEEDLALLQQMPNVPIPNYAFRNNGDLTFTNEARAWGLADEGFSNGAAYADLDNDGDLDLVTNDINAPASIYENMADEKRDGHFLTVALDGAGGNTAGIGAKVFVRQDGQVLLREQMPARGFQSSVDPRLHFGLGASAVVDTLVVVWPDRRFQVLTDVPADTLITLRQEEADGAYRYTQPAPTAPLFEDVTDAFALTYRHEENSFLDWTREPLMPHRLSTEGPALAVGDVNGDELDDFYVGGAKWQPGRLFLQTRDAAFTPASDATWRADSLHEDTDAAFFDADGDGDLDLYVTSGGNEFWGEADALRDRLYVNDGRGQFSRSRDALPDFYGNGSVVAPADYDGDGDTDLFVGSRVLTNQYGVPPTSHLLQNDGAGRFIDVTPSAEGLATAGMVSDAAWLDYDGDGRLDLAVVGEWMPVRSFVQQEDGFVETTDQAGLNETHGWWNAVTAADFDRDGDSDLVAGNLGLNSRLKASAEEPSRLYVRDFDGNGRLDQFLTTFRGGTSYLLATRDQAVSQINSLAERYPTYKAYGAAKIEDLFRAGELRAADVLEARTFASTFFENRGDGTFAVRPLPNEAQMAPTYALLPDDFDGDGSMDLLLAGNFYGVPPALGRYDASYGTLLLGDGRGALRPADRTVARLVIEGEVRDVQPLRTADGSRLLLVARNNDRLQVLRRTSLPTGLIATK